MSILPAGRGRPRIRNLRAHGAGLSFTLAAVAFLGLAACKKETPPATKPPVDVTVMTVNARDTPVEFEYTAQTQSSREVEIRARVEGFLERRLYREGDLVKAGQVLFQMDRKPFEAALQSA